MILSPSLLSADCGKLAEELAELEAAGLTWAHWDVMDGRFVPNITFGQHVIRQLRPRSRLVFDAHLMIEEPDRHLAAFQEAGVDRLTVHAETGRHLQRTLAEIRRLGMRSGLALNPATPLCVLDHLLDDVDMVLVMSVNPGFGGQSFIPASREKIRQLRAMLDVRRPDILIQVDGGVTPENVAALKADGADVLVSGSAFFKYASYREARLAFERNTA
ncbi:MAG: ribulose-phosphate 3-epimerase [Deltaproteobacteria bacterium]|jgi:ribulose-phosphate 3-epimerase|nr:ribulose-phosphate 3-epimerase [Deltaproteobacteria bacterium]